MKNPIAEDYGKRTTGAYVDDKLIVTKAKVNLKKTDERFNKTKFNVYSHNGVVLITGQVPDANMRTTATETIQKIRKVRRVHNELEVAPPRSFSSTLSDAWLSSKVKTRFLFTKGIESRRIKVILENGVVYLMGLVTQKEADVIVETAKKSYGIQKIVRVFEYIE